MNSENPSVPESGNSSSENIELSDSQVDNSSLAETSEFDVLVEEWESLDSDQLESQTSSEEDFNLEGEVNPELSLPDTSESREEDEGDRSSSDSSFLDFVDNPAQEESIAGQSMVNNIESLIHEEGEESLQQQKTQLQNDIAQLKAEKERILLEQTTTLQNSLARMVDEGIKELQERKTALRVEIDKLERRKERINQEMRSNFVGSSKELAIKVQGFKEYLVGSLQDLATAADKLELAKPEMPPSRRRDANRERLPQEERGRREERGQREERGSRRGRDSRNRTRNSSQSSSPAQFSEPTFADQSRKIRQLLDQYRNSPDYYGSPWQLRRTFEVSQAKRVQEWFFGQGGRGTVDSMGSRLQNILVASAAVSVLHNLYGDRCRVLVLTDTPENLGEWRRGLQDCLGISRSNFGANRGVVLFDAPEVLVQRAERLISDKLLPVIIIDETEEILNLSVLKFPLWLAFASTNKSTSANYLY